MTKGYDSLFRHEEWNIGIIHKPISSLLKRIDYHIDWIPRLVKDGYLADPFSISFKGKTYVLCEEFEYKSSRGRIVSFEFDENFSPSKPTTSLEFPFHTAYPYLFEFDGSVYCVPETAQAREISLFRSDEFPSRWRKVCTLVDDFAGYDPTVFNHKGTWWLSVTGCDDQFSKLFLWHATSLFGPWNAHERKPVKVDPRSSRPGGTPFNHEGNLYRPAQDCSTTYGGRIVINRILSLTEHEFREEEVAVIKPDKNYPSGLHTVTQAGEVTLVDGRRIVFNRAAFRHALISAPSEFSRYVRRQCSDSLDSGI